MKLTTYTDYSFRVLMYLANKPDELCTIQEISDAYQVSKNHLMKVVFELGKLGYVETVRGRQGGMRLNERPDQINLGALVRQTEDNMIIAECFDANNNSCKITKACRLKHILQKATAAFLAVLDGYTLEDLVRSPGTFANLLYSSEAR